MTSSLPWVYACGYRNSRPQISRQLKPAATQGSSMRFIGLFPLCLLLAGPVLATEPVDYVRDVKPILAQNCYSCHGAAKQRSGLRLDTAASARKGGNSGPAVIPGNSGASRLFRAVTGADDVKPMPPKEPRLNAKQIATLKAWIDAGARAPADEKPESFVAGKEGHWAFQAPLRPD